MLRNHGEAECSYKAGDWISQLITERIADADAIQLDDLGTTERGKKGFGSSDLSLKRPITAKEEKIQICLVFVTVGRGGFSLARPRPYTGRGGVFFR